MEIVQSILRFGLCLSRDDIRPAGVIIMSGGSLYVNSCGFDVETKSERDQDSLHSQRHESRYRWRQGHNRCSQQSRGQTDNTRFQAPAIPTTDATDISEVVRLFFCPSFNNMELTGYTALVGRYTTRRSAPLREHGHCLHGR